MVYVIQFCWQLASRIRTFRPDPDRKLYDIYHCCVHSETPPDDWQRKCPKHVEFYSKNKFEKLAHLVCFIIRIYHDARSPERQTIFLILSCPYMCTDVTILRSNQTNALYMLPPLYLHRYIATVCSVTGYLHLDTQCVDPAHKVYQYSLGVTPWGLKHAAM
jgi:hypothetical protein